MTTRRRRSSARTRRDHNATQNRSNANARRQAAPKDSGRAGSPGERDFWGDAATLPPGAEKIHITKDPSAVVRSLGRPSLSGRETAAEHYLRAVYDRAVNLAGALAAVGELIEADDDADAPRPPGAP